MTEIDHPTLQSVLCTKYNINEKLYAEGRFVSLLGDHGISLVCLGISMKCLVIARVLLNDDIMDYELLYIIPLTVLSLSCDFITHKIMVRNQYKPTQMFQLCSSSNQLDVWNNFTTIIKNINYQLQPGIWQHPTLKSVSSKPSYKENNNDIHFIPIPQPSILTSEMCSVNIGVDLVEKINNVDCLDVHFDSFVNDNVPVNTKSDIPLVVEDDKVQHSNDKITTGGKVKKIFKRLFSRRG